MQAQLEESDEARLLTRELNKSAGSLGSMKELTQVGQKHMPSPSIMDVLPQKHLRSNSEGRNS